MKQLHYINESATNMQIDSKITYKITNNGYFFAHFY